MNRTNGWLWVWLTAALVLRLAIALAQDPLLPYQNRGGDSWWYLLNGFALVGGVSEATVNAQVSTLQPPPGYLIFVGLPQLVLPPAPALLFIRLVQVVLSVATCYCVYRIAQRVAGERAGLIALALTSLSPVFILESVQITTETLYIFWVALGLLTYLEWFEQPTWQRMLLIGATFGMATLTRAVLLLFPLGLLLHLLLVHRSWRVWRYAGALLLAYALVVSTWTIYNRLVFDRWVIAGEGFAAMLYIGSVGYESPFEVDAQLEQDSGAALEDGGERQTQYLDGTLTVILRDLPDYLARRGGELATAYLQPHGTLYFPGESLRELALRWLTQDRSFNGLLTLIQGDAFFPKLALYVFHYASIVLGLLGMWHSRRNWRVTLPLIGFVVYVTLLHLALFALPRYIFPTTIVWYCFAAVWLAQAIRVKSNVTTQPVLAKDGVR